MIETAACGDIPASGNKPGVSGDGANCGGMAGAGGLGANVGWAKTAAGIVGRHLAAADMPDCPQLAEAVRYALLGGGKRVRPLMLVAAACDCPPPPQHSPAWQLACALECLHCYSLIHDDLPCMDNADSRRGKPSCHLVYGEAMALLAGDCLQAMAFGLAANSGVSHCAAFLADAACRIVGGQAQDIAGNATSEDALISMYGGKTGALFVCAVRLGLLCRGFDDARARRLDGFAGHFGVLFQIVNDIGGESADRIIGKKTIVTEFGTNRAADIARRHQTLAAAELQKYPSPPLAELLGAFGIGK